MGFGSVNQAKGIYKPHYGDYALGVRQTLDGPYADEEVTRRPDGSWVRPRAFGVCCYGRFRWEAKPGQCRCSWSGLGNNMAALKLV